MSSLPLLVPCCCQCCYCHWYCRLGHWDGRHFYHVWGHLGHGHCCHSGEGEKPESWAPLPPPALFGWWVLLSLVGVGEAGVAGAALAGGTRVMGPTTAAVRLPVAMGAIVAGRPRSHVPPLLLLPGSVGLQTQPLWPGARIPALPLLVPGSASSVCPNSPTFRCTDVWISPASCCVGQRKLSGVRNVSLVVD